jgi:enamine deaminase RidA (YjgF/YER057c/UK114 family)
VTPHELVNPDGLAAPVGYAHAVVAAPGRLVFLAGQVASDADGVCRGETLAEQFERALGNVVAALRAAGGEPEHLVSMHIYTTDIAAYRAGRNELGERYRAVIGRHYPAMALFEVSALVDPAALVEIVCTAVVT